MIADKISNRPAPLMPTYARFDVAFERGEGAYLFDTDGKRYLDFAAGIAVNALGHCHPALVDAVTRQAGRLWHVSNMYHIPGQERLAERLVEACFADAVFFTNSGVEAIECAFKLARKYHFETGAPERFRIVTVKGAFHGRSLAAIAASGKEKLTKGFGPLPDGFDNVGLGDIEVAIGDQTAAVLLEPIQGEGGLVPISDETLQHIREITIKAGILLILDEVQTGMGRTGRLFAHQWAGIAPDIVATAKGLGGGFPLGACLATESVASALTVGSHGTTFGGNPLAMAVGNAVLDEILRDGFLQNVQNSAARLREGLEALQSRSGGVIRDVRGLGLMIGVEIDRPVRPVLTSLMKQGFLAAQAGERVIRLLPPLIIGKAEIDAALDFLAEALIEA